MSFSPLRRVTIRRGSAAQAGLIALGILGSMALAGSAESTSDRDVCKDRLPAIKETLSSSPTDEKAWMQVRACISALKRWTEGEAFAQEILQKHPDIAEAHFLLGITKMHSKDYSKAADEFDEAIRLKPKQALPRYYFGMAKLFMNEPAAAATSSEQAIELEPNNPIHYGQLAYAYLLLDEREKCETAAKKAVELDPNNVAAYKVLGNLYAKEGRQQDSEKMFDEAIHANGRTVAQSPFVADKRELPGMAKPGAASAVAAGAAAGRAAAAGAVVPAPTKPIPSRAMDEEDIADAADPVAFCESQWNSMKAAMLKGDTEGALRYFSDYSDTRLQYRAAFQRLGDRTRDIFTNFGELSDCNVVLASVTCKAFVHNGQGTTVETSVRFERNSDRVWRIRSF